MALTNGVDGWEPVDVPDAPPESTAAVTTDTAVTVVAGSDGKAECPGCGGRFKVTADGKITGQHKCPGVHSVDRATTTTTVRKRRKAKGAPLPDEVRKFAVAMLGSGVEYGSATLVGAYVPCPAEAVPSDLEDADAMVGPIVDATWPQLPRKAQVVLEQISDQSDLIACLFAWWSWGVELRKWAEESKRQTASLQPPHLQSVGTVLPFVSQAPPFAPAEEGPADAVTASAEVAWQEPDDGGFLPPGVESFQPASP